MDLIKIKCWGTNLKTQLNMQKYGHLKYLSQKDQRQSAPNPQLASSKPRSILEFEQTQLAEIGDQNCQK